MSQAALTANNIRTYSLIAGIANAVAAIAGTIVVLAFGASTFGCGCVFIILPLLHVLACIVDFLAYARLGQPPDAAVYSVARTSAVLDLASGLAIVPLVMGIMKLQLLGNEEVRQYFQTPPLQ